MDIELREKEIHNSIMEKIQNQMSEAFGVKEWNQIRSKIDREDKTSYLVGIILKNKKIALDGIDGIMDYNELILKRETMNILISAISQERIETIKENGIIFYVPFGCNK